MPPRPPIDILAELGLLRCRQVILAEFNNPTTIRDGVNGVVDPRGCWKSTQQQGNEGYCTRSIRPTAELNRFNQGLLPLNGNGYKTFYLHKVAYVVKHGHNPPAGKQCSHVCDEPSCFNPDHITDETGQENRSRSYCWGIVRCPWHNHIVLDICQHIPKCMKPPLARADFNCCRRDDLSDHSQPTPQQLRSQATVNDLNSDDYSELPANSLALGSSTDTGEDPRSGGPEIPETSEMVPPSSPPILAGTRRRAARTDNDSDEPPSQRTRTEQSTSEATQSFEITHTDPDHSSDSSYLPS